MSKELVPKLRFPEFKNSEQWETKPLGNIAENLDYKRVPITSNERKKGKVPYYGASGIIDFVNDFIFDESLLCISEDGANLIDRNYPIAFPIIGKTWVNNHAHVLKFEDLSTQTLVEKYLNAISLEDFLTGMAQPKLNRAKLDTIPIPFPSHSEQKKIANCLSSLDELITAQSQKLEALKAHKKGLMQQLFPAEGTTVPKLRFAEFKNSEEWEVCTVGNYIESYKGGAPLTPSDFVLYSNYEVIPKKGIGEGIWLNLNADNPTYCSESFYQNNPQSIIDSTYLITTLRDLVPSGPNIGFIVKYKGMRKYILAQGVYGLKLKNNICPEFLIHFSNTKRYRKLVNAIMVGSTQVHIRNTDFFNLQINIPALEEQEKVASSLSSLDNLITQQAEKIASLKAHKKGLMQQLFPNTNDIAE